MGATIVSSNLNLELVDQRHEFISESASAAIRDLDGYFCIVEELLEKAEARELSLLRKDAQRLPKERRSTFWQWNYPFHWRDVFVPQFRLSFVVWALGVNEFHLDWVCETVRMVTRLSDSCDTAKKRGKISRAKDFLERVGGFRPSVSDAWADLGGLYRIRNAVAHAGGYVHDERRRNQLEQLFKRFPGVGIVNGALEVESDFCRAVCKTVAGFLRYLLDEEAAMLRRQT